MPGNLRSTNLMNFHFLQGVTLELPHVSFKLDRTYNFKVMFAVERVEVVFFHDIQSSGSGAHLDHNRDVGQLPLIYACLHECTAVLHTTSGSMPCSL